MIYSLAFEYNCNSEANSVSNSFWHSIPTEYEFRIGNVVENYSLEIFIRTISINNEKREAWNEL